MMVFFSFKQYQAGLLFCFLAHVCWNSLGRGEGTQIQRKLFYVRFSNVYLFLWIAFINSNCTCNRTFRYLLWQVLFILLRASHCRMKSDGGAFWNNVYITPWCRVAAFCVGLFLGVIFYKRPKANLSRVTPKSYKTDIKRDEKMCCYPMSLCLD